MTRSPLPPLAQCVPDVYQRFLLLCLRNRWLDHALDEARQLCAAYALDWSVLGQLAVCEGVAPLLYASVRGQELTPQWLELELRQIYDLNAVRNARLLHELALALQALDHAGIAAIVLKGAALAETVYGNIALRPMFDLDLLVHREAVLRATSVLTELGYRLQTPEVYGGAVLDNENEVLLHKRGALDVALELHWSLIDSPFYQRTVAMNWFWETAMPIRMEGTQTLALGLEALLLHLCVHLALHHHGAGLLRQHDVAEIVHAHREQLDWEQVLARSQTWDLVLPTRQVLATVAQDWQAPIPGEVLQRLADLRPSPAEARVYAWLTAAERPVAQRFWADLASMPRWQERLRYGMGSLIPSAAYMRQRYDITRPSLLPLYYPYRWWLGLAGVLRSGAGRLRT